MLERSRLGLEPEAGAVAGEAQQARRVLGEAQLVQGAQASGAKVLEGILDCQELALARTAQRQGDGVDGEVAPCQVLLEASLAHDRQGPRGPIGLGAPLGDVDPPVAPSHRGRAEALVDDREDRSPVGALAGRDRCRQRAGQLG